MGKLYYPELSYQVIGILFEVYNQLGYGHREVVYQRAVMEELKNKKVSFKREIYFPIKYKGAIVSKYFFDFLIDEKIILEIKASKEIHDNDVGQILSYLKNKGVKLGIIVVFSPSGLLYKRIVY